MSEVPLHLDTPSACSSLHRARSRARPPVRCQQHGTPTVALGGLLSAQRTEQTLPPSPAAPDLRTSARRELLPSSTRRHLRPRESSDGAPQPRTRGQPPLHVGFPVEAACPQRHPEAGSSWPSWPQASQMAGSLALLGGRLLGASRGAVYGHVDGAQPVGLVGRLLVGLGGPAAPLFCKVLVVHRVPGLGFRV